MVEHDENAAFPYVTHGGLHEHQFVAFGLTKRELFAAMAMQALVEDSLVGQPTSIALMAVKHADALVAALSKPEAPAP